jgi:ribonuclease P protein component
VAEDEGRARPPEHPGARSDAPEHLIASLPRRAKRGRLSRSAEFERVYRQGRSVANRWLVVYAFPRDAAARGEDDAPHLDAERPRLGLSVSRKVGGAVPRNLVKRLVREAFDAAAAGGLPSGQDVVVVARPPARELAEQEGLEGMRRALDELLEKALVATPAR